MIITAEDRRLAARACGLPFSDPSYYFAPDKDPGQWQWMCAKLWINVTHHFHCVTAYTNETMPPESSEVEIEFCINITPACTRERAMQEAVMQVAVEAGRRMAMGEVK